MQKDSYYWNYGKNEPLYFGFESTNITYGYYGNFVLALFNAVTSFNPYILPQQLFSFENISDNGLKTKIDICIEQKASINKAIPIGNPLSPSLAKTIKGIDNKHSININF